MPNFCAVINCASNGARDRVSFFRFPSIYDCNKRIDPRKQKRREAWIAALKRADMTDLKLKYQMVCEKHFLSGKPAKLEDEGSPDWIPTKNMGYERPVANCQRYSRRKRRNPEIDLIMEEVTIKVEIEQALDDVDEPTSDVLNEDNIKKEFSVSEEELNDVVKQEEIPTEWLHKEIKSEVPDTVDGITNDDNSFYINLGLSLKTEEVIIKTESDETVSDETSESLPKTHGNFCTICNSKFASKKGLKRHLDIHTKEKEFQCSICDYKCIRNYVLQQHMKIHLGEKKFICSECDYRCVLKSRLKRHIMNIHSREEKRFQCNLCDYKNAHKANLQYHMRTHSGEKPFKCDVCNYKSVRKGNLQEHMKNHTGEKPFKCGLCNYRSGRKNNVQQHLKKHGANKK